MSALPALKTLPTKLALSLGTLVCVLAGLELACRVTPLGDKAIRLEIPREKAPGAFRILFLGASTVRGIPIPDWGPVAQLDFGLKRLRPDLTIELINGGVAGKDSGFVREVLDQTLDSDVDLLILLTGHNEFIDRKPPGRRQSPLNKSLSRSALVRALLRLRPHLGLESHAHDEIFPDELFALDRGSELFSSRLAAYADNLTYMVEQAQQWNIPVLLCTLPSNLSDWPPVFRNLQGPGYDDTYRAEVTELRQALAAGDLSEAADTRIRELARSRPGDAMAQFLLGRMCMAREDWAGAYAAFVRARDLDAYPQRAISELNQVVRKTARKSSAILVDLERALTKHATHGLVGFDLIGDNVHPSPYGNHVIAHSIIRALAANRILLAPEDGRKPADDVWNAFREEHMWTSRGASLRLKYKLLNATYSMKVPFFNFEVAHDYFLQALEQRPFDWRVWANLATLALLRGDTERGRKLLMTAISHHGGALDTADLTNTPYLRIALERTGLTQESLIF